MTLPKGYKHARFSRKNFKRAMYYPTLNETLIGMGIIFLLLSIFTFYRPIDDSRYSIGDALVYLASATEVSQSVICLLIGLFFFGLVIYLILRSRFRKVLSQEGS